MVDGSPPPAFHPESRFQHRITFAPAWMPRSRSMYPRSSREAQLLCWHIVRGDGLLHFVIENTVLDFAVSKQLCNLPAIAVGTSITESSSVECLQYYDQPSISRIGSIQEVVGAHMALTLAVSSGLRLVDRPSRQYPQNVIPITKLVNNCIAAAAAKQANSVRKTSTDSTSVPVTV